LVEARQESNNPFNRKSIRGALRAWDNSQQLGGHPLAHLGITEARRRAAGYQETATGRGVALRDVLRDAIDELRPDDADPDPLEKRWRFYITVTEQYLNGLSPDFVAEQLGIERSTYNHGQAEALDTLADILRRWEESHGTPRPTPISLIPRTSAFRGRNQELRYYLKQLEEDHLSIITGMAGTGKTALGAEIAVRFQERMLSCGLLSAKVSTLISIHCFGTSPSPSTISGRRSSRLSCSMNTKQARVTHCKRRFSI